MHFYNIVVQKLFDLEPGHLVYEFFGKVPNFQ